MKLSNTSSVPVYTVSGSSTERSLPEWLSKKRKRSLKQDPEYAHRVELLQDFEFEEASQCVRISEDGQWVMSTGTYKPQIHTHYLPNLSLSWARHTDTINKTFLILSSDYSKTVHLQEDRSIEFHTPGGCHYTMRIPRYGRDLAYNRSAAELLVPAVGVNANGMGEVFRINLEQGRFMREYEIDVGGDDFTSIGGGALQGGIRTGSVNTASMAEGSHNLMAFGTSIGTVEYWDTRARARVATLMVPKEHEDRPEVTALSFHRSGISTAVGTSGGLVYLYDLRSTKPHLTKDQSYGYPIHTVEFLTPSTESRIANPDPKILSADKRIIKIWDERDGTPWTSVEPSVDINCVAWCKDSGMIMTANEGRQQHVFLIPQLGPAPRWCSFLDNVVEEMAEDPNDPNAYSSTKAGEIYKDQKFLTLPEMRTLNLEQFIGETDKLTPYMHGFMVAQRLYDDARLLANHSTWEEERAKRIQEKIDKERESRIRGKKKVTAKVNRKMAEKILEREEKNERRRAQRALTRFGEEKPPVDENTEGAEEKEEKGVLGDSRFARLFQDEDFEVDETSREFQSLNPSTKPAAAPPSNLDREKRLTAVEQEALDNVPGSSSDNTDTDSEEDVFKARKSDMSSNRISSADYRRRPNKKEKQKGKKQGIQMQVSSSTSGGRTARSTLDRSFGARAENIKPRDRIRKGGSRGAVLGEKVITFEPERKKKPDARTGGDRAGAGRDYDLKDRRSASGNTFRRM